MLTWSNARRPASVTTTQSEQTFRPWPHRSVILVAHRPVAGDRLIDQVVNLGDGVTDLQHSGDETAKAEPGQAVELLFRHGGPPRSARPRRRPGPRRRAPGRR